MESTEYRKSVIKHLIDNEYTRMQAERIARENKHHIDKECRYDEMPFNVATNLSYKYGSKPFQTV